MILNEQKIYGLILDFDELESFLKRLSNTEKKELGLNESISFGCEDEINILKQNSVLADFDEYICDDRGISIDNHPLFNIHFVQINDKYAKIMNHYDNERYLLIGTLDDIKTKYKYALGYTDEKIEYNYGYIEEDRDISDVVNFYNELKKMFG